jgi:PAS domain-containing protein
MDDIVRIPKREFERLQGQARELAAVVNDLKQANELITNELVERKKAEQALRESGEYVRRLIEVSPVASVVSSGTDEGVLFINRKFSELFGYTIEDMLDVEHNLGRHGAGARPERDRDQKRQERLYPGFRRRPASRALA